MLKKLDEIPIKTTLEHLITTLRLEDPEDIQIISNYYAEAVKIAKPKVLYREAYVEEINGSLVYINGVKFESTVLAMTLKDISRVFAYVCTCGTEVDEWSQKEKDYVVSLWLDIMKEMFLGDASLFFKEHIKTAFQYEQLSSINPGSGELESWPITQQAPLFEMITDVKKEIGVILTDSFLMVPIKSTSGLLFSSETGFDNCALCTRKNCPNRRAELDAALYERVFGVS